MADPPFIVAETSLLSASIPRLIQYYLVFLIVFGIETLFDGMRYLRISPNNSGYGCDTSNFCNLLYHITRDMISPSTAIYYAIWPRITPKQAKTTSTKTDHLVEACVLLWLLVSTLFLPCLPPGLFCRPSVAHQVNTSQNWPYHRQTSTLSPRDSACYLSSWLFLLRFSVFFLSLSHYPSCYIIIAWYRYRDIPNMFSV